MNVPLLPGRIEHWPLARLKPYARNAKTHDADQVARVAASSKDDLRTLSDQARDRLASGVVVLGAEIDGSPTLLVMATRDIAGGKVHAGNLIREIVPLIDGRGGGRPDLAEAGGKDASGLDAALSDAKTRLATVL